MHSNRPSFWATVVVVAKREIVTRFLSKSFIISTIVTLGLLLALMVFGPQLSNLMSGTPSVAASTDLAPMFAGLSDVELTEVADDAAAISLVQDGTVGAAVVTDPSHPIGFKIVALNEIPRSLVSMLSLSPTVELLNPEAPNPGIYFALSLGFGMVWMMSAITFGMSIAQSVVEEKQTRIVEILLASITSRALLTGKVIGSSVAAMTQIVAIAATAIIGMKINGDSFPVANMVAPILWFVVLFIFGFLMVAAMYAAAAALVSRTEDLNNVLQPFVWVVMIPYFGVVFAGENATALAVMSYIPISAPVAVPLRVFLGHAAAWELLLSIAIVVLTTAVVLWLAAKIYDRGLLRLGKPLKWREALSNAD